MWKLIAFVLFATAAAAQEYPDAPGWYLIGPIKAEGHKIPATYNQVPYVNEGECNRAFNSEEFWKTFRKWQEVEIDIHKGEVEFGPPACIEVEAGFPI